MSIRADYHLHSSFSGDSETPMEDMIRQGIASGLTALCFTEHMDLDYVYELPQEEGMFELNAESYRQALFAFREKYRERIQLLFGIELGLQPHLAERLLTYTDNYDFDFIIGSSHLCNGKDPYYPSFYKGRSDEEAYREYFLSILENLKVFDNFDVYGHIDYVVRYGKTKDENYCYEAYQDIFEQILKVLIQKGKGLEINTGAISYGLKELNPCTAILRRYRQLGGELVTVGSDAHDTQNLARGFDRAAQILKDCGFRYYTVFEKRKPSFLPL